jgi:hypothetical protein
VHATVGRVHATTDQLYATIDRVTATVAECLELLAECLEQLVKFLKQLAGGGGGRLPRNIIHVLRLIELNLVSRTCFTYGLDNLSYKV